MHLSTDGLVIKERSIGDDDKILTLLTRNNGVIECSARGIRRPKSRLLSGGHLLSFSSFDIFKGKNNYILNSAENLKSFHKISNDLAAMSLAFYFCDLAALFAPAEAEAEDFLRLMMIAFVVLEDDMRDRQLVKAAFELKAVQLAGFEPQLSCCAHCEKNHGDFFFSVNDSALFCTKCRDIANENSMALSRGALSAMRFVVSAEIQRIFSFNLSAQSMRILSAAAERCVLFNADRGFKSLAFYKSIM